MPPTSPRLRFARPSPATAIALIALFVSLSGTGYAVSKLPRNSVSTSQLRNSAVTSGKIRNRAIRLADISTTTRNSLRGSTGPQGPPGTQGPAGTPGVTFHAAINSGGGRARGNAIAGGGGGGLGIYTVEWDRDVSGCQAAATLASVPGGTVTDPPAGRITVRPNGRRIEIRTYDTDATPRDLPFNIIVAC